MLQYTCGLFHKTFFSVIYATIGIFPYVLTGYAFSAVHYAEKSFMKFTPETRDKEGTREPKFLG